MKGKKSLKGLASLVLSLVMVMGLATTAVAADTTGSITVTNPRGGNIYRI